MDQLICKNCGANFTGNYCNMCGEKVYHDHHKTVGHLLEEAFHFITHFEGNIFRSIKLIFTRPGQLSVDYCNGIRKKYFKPVSLFLFFIVLYLLFSPFKGLNMQFGTYVSKDYNYRSLARPLVLHKMHAHSITAEEIANKYNEESPHISKIMLLVLLPLMGLTLYLLFYNKSHFYFDHFILSSELASTLVSIQYIIVAAIMLLITRIVPSTRQYFNDSNWALWVLIDLILLGYLVAGFKKFYGQNWFWTIFKSVLFLFIFQFVLMPIYHVLLFLIVMLFI